MYLGTRSTGAATVRFKQVLSTRYPCTSPLRSLASWAPQDTDFYSLDPADKLVLGEGRVQSTRLQAATRRVVEHLFVYDALEQAFVEEEAQLNFGDPVTPRRPTNQPDWFARVPSSLIAEQLLANGGQHLTELSLTDYIDRVESIPQHPIDSRTAWRNLKRLLKSEDRSSGFLARLAKAFAQLDSIEPGSLGFIMEELVRKGHHTVARSVFDSFLMSRSFLGIKPLAGILGVAAVIDDRELFTMFARLVKLPTNLPPPGTLSSGLIGEGGNRATPNTQNGAEKEFDAERDGPVWRRFFKPDVQTPGSFNRSKELARKLAQGYAHFGDRDRLDRTMWLAYQERMFSAGLVSINLLAAQEWNDNVRANWTRKVQRELRLSTS